MAKQFLRILYLFAAKLPWWFFAAREDFEEQQGKERKETQPLFLWIYALFAVNPFSFGCGQITRTGGGCSFAISAMMRSLAICARSLPASGSS